MRIINPESLYGFGLPESQYAKLLRRQEWREKREQILHRDGHICKSCGKKETVWLPVKNGPWKNVWIEEDPNCLPNRNRVVEAGKRYHLEIHHHLYIVNRLPWDYDDKHLITYCNWCHHEFHKNNKVPIYNEDLSAELNYTPCFRCNGAGWFPEYSHVSQGVCFRCDGTRYEELFNTTEPINPISYVDDIADDLPF